ncbi:TlpA disulfide reductase family protein [Arcobacter sp. 15-2]|uniref:TlpA family protein disulfide reductase n=1 Tax=Arcobacter sp. 15-2 TaxID=3374109 RepID=UPI00399D252A
MKIKKITILSFLALLLITGCGEKEQIEENVVVESEKETTPKFNLKTTSGKEISIIMKKEGWEFQGLEDKVILLNFFGTWCPPCKAEIPHLNTIRSKLKKDFEVLAIDVGPRGGGLNSAEHLAEFKKEFNVTYPIVSGEIAKRLFGAVSELNPSGSIPFMVLFNKQGKYVQYYIGMKPEEMLFHDISTTIKMK